MRRLLLLLACSFCVFLLSCEQGTRSRNYKSKETNEVESEAKEETDSVAKAVQTEGSGFQPFIVYQDKGSRNRFTPSGYMPDGDCLNLTDRWQEECLEGSTCIKIDYNVECSRNGRKWAGVYWQNPADNWGGRKGGYNLTQAQKLKFWAKGVAGGERIEEFKVGGMGVTAEYPDSDVAVIGPVILTDEWKEYTIDLRGKDLSNIAGGFAWVTNSDVNPNDVSFYLDHIRYE